MKDKLLRRISSCLAWNGNVSSSLSSSLRNPSLAGELKRTCNWHEKSQLLLQHQTIFAVWYHTGIADSRNHTSNRYHTSIVKNTITKWEVIWESLHFDTVPLRKYLWQKSRKDMLVLTGKKKKNGRCLRGEPTSFSEGPCFGGSIDTSVECEIGGTHWKERL